jgi:hypothetical protein
LYKTPAGGSETLAAIDAVTVEVVSSPNGTVVRFGSPGGPYAAAAAAVVPPGTSRIQMVVGDYDLTNASGAPLIADLRIAVFTIKPVFTRVAGDFTFVSGKPTTSNVEFEPLFRNGDWAVFLDPSIDYLGNASWDQSAYLVQMTALDDGGGVLSLTLTELKRVLWVATPA